MVCVANTMKITYKNSTSPLAKTDLLIVFGREGKKLKLPPGVKIPDNATTSFGGGERETRLTDSTAGPAKRVLQIGLGDDREISTELVRRAAAIGAKKAEKTGAASAVFWIGTPLGKKAAEFGQAIAEGAVMGSCRLSSFQNEAKPAILKRVAICGDAALRNGARRGEIIGGANCLARRLQDSPANHMRPRDMVSEARKIARGSSAISINVLDEKAMTNLKMGSLLSVSRGSSEPAYLIHLAYKPAKKARRKICLVGKGLTFDSGGISIMRRRRSSRTP